MQAVSDPELVGPPYIDALYPNGRTLFEPTNVLWIDYPEFLKGEVVVESQQIGAGFRTVSWARLTELQPTHQLRGSP